MKAFMEPTIEVLKFAVEDVITTSNVVFTEPDQGAEDEF